MDFLPDNVTVLLTGGNDLPLGERKTFSTWDYAVFGLLLLGSSAVGVFYAWKDRNAKTNENFLRIGGEMGIFPVSISLMASYVSAITILAIPGEMYTHGSQFWLCIVGIFMAVAATDYLFLPVLYDLNLASINKYFSMRFHSKFLRSFCSLVSIFGTLFYLGAVLFGPSLAISSVTDLDLWTSIVSIGVVCTFYTTVGGLKAVVWTDVIQMIIMTIGLLVVIVKIAYDVGGVSEIFQIADRGGRIDFKKFGAHVFQPEPSFWDSIFNPAITWTSAFVASQTSIQRICGMPTYRKARIITWLNIPGVFFLTSLACMCGVSLYSFYYDCDPLTTKAIEKPDQLMPYYVMNAFAAMPGLPGVFVACVFSASLSTLSSGLNAMSAITWGDFLKHIFKVEGKAQIYITKLTAVAYGAIVIGVAFLSNNIGSILQASLMLSGPLNASLFVVMILGVLVPFANTFGAIASVVVSVIFCLWTGIGGAIISRPQYNLPISIEGCPGYNASIHNFTSSSEIGLAIDNVPFVLPTDITIMQYFSPYFVTTCSFFLALLTGLIVSAVTGGAKGDVVDSHLVHPAIVRFSKRMQQSKRYGFWFPQYVTRKESVSRSTVNLDTQKQKKDSISEPVKTRF